MIEWWVFLCQVWWRVDSCGKIWEDKGYEIGVVKGGKLSKTLIQIPVLVPSTLEIGMLFSVALGVKNPPASAGDAGDLDGSLSREDPLEKEMQTHSGILAWRNPWTEEPGRLQSMGSQRVGYDWVTKHTCTHAYGGYVSQQGFLTCFRARSQNSSHICLSSNPFSWKMHCDKVPCLGVACPEPSEYFEGLEMGAVWGWEEVGGGEAGTKTFVFHNR